MKQNDRVFLAKSQVLIEKLEFTLFSFVQKIHHKNFMDESNKQKVFKEIQNWIFVGKKRTIFKSLLYTIKILFPSDFYKIFKPQN